MESCFASSMKIDMPAYSANCRMFDFIFMKVFESIILYVEIKCQLDATDGFFIADLIAC